MIYVCMYTVPTVFSILRLCHQPCCLLLWQSFNNQSAHSSLTGPSPEVLCGQTNPPKCSATQGTHANSLITDAMYVSCS